MLDKENREIRHYQPKIVVTMRDHQATKDSNYRDSRCLKYHVYTYLDISHAMHIKQCVFNQFGQLRFFSFQIVLWGAT